MQPLSRKSIRGMLEFNSFTKFLHAAKQLGAVNVGDFEFGGVPNSQQLQSYAVVRPDVVEAVRQPLYDRLLYPNAGINELRFFQQPIGQGVSTASGNAANTKALEDTNMTGAGSLPKPLAQLVTSIEVMVDAGTTTTAAGWTRAPISGIAGTTTIAIGADVPAQAQNDVQAIVEGGLLDFFIISKSYVINSRLDSFPPKSILTTEGAVSAGSTLNVLSQGAIAKVIGQPFFVNPPVVLWPNTNFVVSLRWPILVPTPSGFAARITVRLNGIQYRNAQ